MDSALGSNPPLTIALGSLAAFEDRTAVRDPRARTANPSLVLRENAALEVRGPFQVRRICQATKPRGRAFVQATGDANPIHTDGFVVPGAWTASQMIAPLEVLIPRFALTSLRVSFTGIAWYDQPVRLILKVTPSAPVLAETMGTAAAATAPAPMALSNGTGTGVASTTSLSTPNVDRSVGAAPGEVSSLELEIDAVAMQGDREVARGSISGRVMAHTSCVEVAERKIDRTWFARVESFFGSLGIASGSYFDKPEGRDLSYPYAFLASLPSGEMVERLSGQGGILNRLTLEFDAGKLPIAGPPEVSLELPERLRKSFNKIVTRIKEGMLTAVRGSALILPKSDVPADILSSLESGPQTAPKPNP